MATILNTLSVFFNVRRWFLGCVSFLCISWFACAIIICLNLTCFWFNLFFLFYFFFFVDSSTVHPLIGSHTMIDECESINIENFAVKKHLIFLFCFVCFFFFVSTRVSCFEFYIEIVFFSQFNSSFIT